MLSQDPLRAVDDFYDGLYIYRLLQAEHERSIKAGRLPIPQHDRASSRNSWQSLLDNLCLLCDTRRGGETTVAIAVEDRQGCHIFWAATQAKDKHTLRHYLSSLLQTMQDSTRAAAADSAPFAEAILITAVRQSKQRIHNYASKLKSAVEDLQRIRIDDNIPNEEDGSSIRRAMKDLQRLLSTRRNHARLCVEADAFCSKTSFNLICRICNENRYNAFYRARHYIGRLAAWYKASKNVICLARSFPQVWNRYRVQVLPAPRTVRYRPSISGEDLEKILCRVLPHFRSSPIFDNALQRLQRAKREVTQRKPLELRAHVESVILCHFRAGSRRFVHKDKYIGCSKPSCYCCHAYFASHGSGIRAGRSHGNVWMKWCLPQLTYRNQLTAQDLGVLRKMTDGLSSDICGILMTNGMAKVALFDSTTGLSPSMRWHRDQSLVSAWQDSCGYDRTSTTLKR